MINVSNDFKIAISTVRHMTAKVVINFIDNTNKIITEEDIAVDGIEINDDTSSKVSFDVGSAIMNTATIKIVNVNDKYSMYDFTNAKLTVFIGCYINSNIEWIQRGVYLVNEPTYMQGMIVLECIDYMNKFEKTLSEAGITFPASLNAIVQNCCTSCGVSSNVSKFENMNYIVSSYDKTDKTTCREALSYVAQIAGCYARISRMGQLEFKWYDLQTINAENYDGGVYDNNTPYASGDTLDGGTYEYDNGDDADGGTFLQQKSYHHIFAYKSCNICTDDVVITGVRVKAQGTKKDYGETVIYGTEGYIIEVTNPFIEEGKAQTVANVIGPKLTGMRFRPMSLDAISDPTIEAGDFAWVTDWKQNSYPVYVTNFTYNIAKTMNIKCSAETPTHNSVQRFSEATKAYIKASSQAEAKLTDYDIAVQQLTSLMTMGFGVFKTEEEQSDGSYIYYMHDKTTLSESVNIWKMTANAFAVSSDGGVTWNAGIDSSGNAVLNILNAKGINADWLRAGTITGRNINNGNGTFSVNENGVCTANSFNSNNANITGGNININSASALGNRIGLNYNTQSTKMYPTGFTAENSASEKTSMNGNQIGLSKWDGSAYQYYILMNEAMGLYMPNKKITCLSLTQTSDEQLKKYKRVLNSKEKSLIDYLEAYTYKFKIAVTEDDRRRIGFYAQDIITAMEAAGLNPDEYTLVEKSDDDVYSVNYIELIPLMLDEIKSLKNRVYNLENNEQEEEENGYTE